MNEDIKKYVDRAADVLGAFVEKEKKNLLKPEDAAKLLIESEKNLKSIESKFNVNRVEILFQYIKTKYPDLVISEKIIKLIQLLKGLSQMPDSESLLKAEQIYQQLILEMRQVEDQIKLQHPEYQRKFDE